MTSSKKQHINSFSIYTSILLIFVLIVIIVSTFNVLHHSQTRTSYKSSVSPSPAIFLKPGWKLFVSKYDSHFTLQYPKNLVVNEPPVGQIIISDPSRLYDGISIEITYGILTPLKPHMVANPDSDIVSLLFSSQPGSIDTSSTQTIYTYAKITKLENLQVNQHKSVHFTKFIPAGQSGGEYAECYAVMDSSTFYHMLCNINYNVDHTTTISQAQVQVDNTSDLFRKIVNTIYIN
jgi:hypothetical protein